MPGNEPLKAIGPLRQSDKVEIIDFSSGIGVTDAKIHRWLSAADRLDDSKEGHIDFDARPQDEIAETFFLGESLEGLEAGRPNTINNPLGLIRPLSLQSIGTFAYMESHIYGPEGKRTGQWEEGATEAYYVKTIKAFEELAAAMLQSLNEADASTRRERVRAEIERIFDPPRKHPWDTVEFDIKKAAHLQTPEEWLVYGVLSILNHPSDDITPVGRLRALELLDIYEIDKLCKEFSLDNHRQFKRTGYSQAHLQRLPYTFCSRTEKLARAHRKWTENPNLMNLIKMVAEREIDWGGTANALVTEKPEEAIQVVMLLLHAENAKIGALNFLAAIPGFDQLTLSRMFGRKATFLLDHKILAGQDIETLIAVGTGIMGSYEDDEIPSDLGRDQLIQLLRAERQHVQTLQDDLVEERTERARLLWENERLKRELSAAKSGRKAPVAEVSDIDPEGYFEVLGLHPSLFKNLSEDEIQEVLRSHFRKLSRTHHPDRGGDPATFIKLKEAYDTLTDFSERQKYMPNS